MSGFPFHKMEACGNDFVVVYRADLPPDASPDLAVAVCDRHFGVGADGILVVDLDPLRMTVWNADGSVAEMCGNGLRCVVRRAVDDGRWSPGPDGRGTMHAATGAIPFVLVGDLVRVTLDPPVLSGALEAIPSEGRTIRGYAVDMGNPHFVVFDADQDEGLPDLLSWAPALETHPRFPMRTNVEHVRVAEDGTLRVRVWERGVGETLACGSGACAVAAAAVRAGRGAADPALVALPGGLLSVFWSGAADAAIDLQGPARTVFAGQTQGDEERP